MTELHAATLVPPPDAPDPRLARSPAAPVPISYSRKIIRLTSKRVGSRLGLTWIGLLVFLAAFAPFLASSHPLLLKQGGRWSSPLFRNLTPVDVILQVAFWAAIVLLFVKRW